MMKNPVLQQESQFNQEQFLKNIALISHAWEVNATIY
jgi:hypothetical protein